MPLTSVTKNMVLKTLSSTFPAASFGRCNFARASSIYRPDLSSPAVHSHWFEESNLRVVRRPCDVSNAPHRHCAFLLDVSTDEVFE